jgi:hypothetical protein
MSHSYEQSVFPQTGQASTTASGNTTLLERPTEHAQTEKQYSDSGLEIIDGYERLDFKRLEQEYAIARQYAPPSECGVMKFVGEKLTGLDSYNASAPIYINDPETGEEYMIIGVRTEARDLENNSKVKFFRSGSAHSNEWHHIDDEQLVDIMGQDPSGTKIDGAIMLNVVETSIAVPASEGVEE